jgi:DNA-directed RNA polymerase subunit RPC12/RpoP
MIRNFLRNFMIGRYGPDHLGVAMILLSIVLSVTYSLTDLVVFLYIAYIIAGFAFFRMLSRNIMRRRAENDKFIRYYWPIKTKIQEWISNFKQRKVYKFFRCPSCRSKLRVPRGKGKIQVTCPKCGERFLQG